MNVIKQNINHNFVQTVECETFVQKIIFFMLTRTYPNFKTLLLLEEKLSILVHSVLLAIIEPGVPLLTFLTPESFETLVPSWILTLRSIAAYRLMAVFHIKNPATFCFGLDEKSELIFLQIPAITFACQWTPEPQTLLSSSLNFLISNFGSLSL